MTSEKKPATENDALDRKIAAIEKEVATVKVAIRRASRTRLALLVAALVIIGVAIGMFYNLAKELGSKENRELLAQKASERAKDTGDRALREARGLAENARPLLEKAFTEQVNKDMPRYREALDKEGMALKENLEKELDKKIRTHFDESQAKYQSILREEFPDLENPELLDKMYASVTDIMERLTNEYYSEKVRSEIEGINDKWLKLEMAALPQAGEPSLDRQLIASLMYLAALKIDEGSVE